jgi:hypothetical protein
VRVGAACSLILGFPCQKQRLADVIFLRFPTVKCVPTRRHSTFWTRCHSTRAITRCVHGWRQGPPICFLSFVLLLNGVPGFFVLGSSQGSFGRPKRIVDREDDYRKRRLNRVLSPARNDAFAMGDKTPDARVRTYGDVLKEQQLARERENTLRNIEEKKKLEAEQAADDAAHPTKASGLAAPAPAQPLPSAGEKRRNRWDQSTDA